jgi:hypothetical protein
MPSPATAGDSLVTVRGPGVTASPGECQPWIGVWGEVLDRPFHFCVYVDSNPPQTVISYLPLTYPYHEGVNTTGCDNSTGAIAHYKGAAFGACAKYNTSEPDPDTFISTDIKLIECEFSPEENGTDPTVQVEGGGVAVCVNVIFEPKGEFPPDPEVIAEPCDKRKSLDPEVRVLGGHVKVCVDYYFFGLTPDVDTPQPPGREDVVRILP